MKKHLLQSLLAVALLLVCGNVWGESTVLFHESFGKNTNSARAWDDSYSVKSGVAAVYSHVAYTITNVKQGKNTTGQTESGLIQSSQGTDAVFEFGPLNVSSYSNLNLSYYWKAASVKGTYTTKVYYKTSSDGTYTEVPNSATGATTFVYVSVDLPEAAQCSTLYLKIVFNTSNAQAIIDEVELKGEKAEPTPAKTLTSIAVSGTPTKKEYNVGDTFDPAGLVVTGTYDDGTTDDVTSECTFSCTPATLTLGTTSVAVKVTCNSIESAIVNINISVSTATEYCLVTDANNLRSGDVIVLGCATTNKAAGVFGDKYFTSVSATIVNGVLTSKDAIEITLGGIAGAWTLTTSEGQITASGAKALKLNDGTQKTCSISIDENNNNASITYGSFGWIQYNSSSPRFVNYTSEQTAIQIYKKVINTQDITISSVGWATASVPFTATVSGATAYTAKVEDGALVKTPITVIPAGTGVLLESVNGASATATFTESGLEGDDVNGNQLCGNATNAAVTWSNEVGATAIFTYYIFANDAEDGLGFYWQKGTGGSSVSCGAYKAALVVPGAPTTEPAAIGYRLDGTTMVEQLLNDSKGAEIYDILGRKVENATKGLYIIGGKKVMVK